MSQNYNLEDVDTRYPNDVAEEIVALYQHCFPDTDASFILPLFDDVKGMFAGEYQNYQAMDTIYHDLEHTLQATLCWVRLMSNRQLLKVEPVIKPKEFQIGLIGILFHDVGYLKIREDKEGTGANIRLFMNGAVAKLSIYIYQIKNGINAIFLPFSTS